jgi:hypothetical protein
VERCVYLDKDLVLPPMAAHGPGEAFYVVASTDLQRAGIMTTRIREQLERMEDLKAKARLTISLVPVELPEPPADASLEQKVEALAARVTELILGDMHGSSAHSALPAKSNPN